MYSIRKKEGQRERERERGEGEREREKADNQKQLAREQESTCQHYRQHTISYAVLRVKKKKIRIYHAHITPNKYIPHKHLSSHPTQTNQK